VFAYTRQLASTLGVATAAWYAASRLLDAATRGAVRIVKYRFVAQPVFASSPTLPERGSSVELRWLRADDRIVVQMPRPPAVVARRFRDGARCLAAVKSGRLIGFLWYKETEYLEDEVRCCYRFDPAVAVWDFDVYVDPEFRLGRLFSRLWGAAHRELHRQGYRWTISRISVFNAASLAAHARMGARTIGRATFLVIGPLQVSFATLTPRLHVSWRADHYPVFVLEAR
jgi:GNAT superfamily N-acetyltransferase